MNHLTDEQFEDIIQGLLPGPEHLADCDRCREILAEKTAIAGRLRSAFASVKPDEQLADNIRMQLTNKAVTKQAQFVKQLWNIRFQRIAWPVAAAAAVLVMAVIFGIYSISPSSAMAAQAELVKIHKHNLSTKDEFHSETDPVKLTEYFKNRLGFLPSMPKLEQGMSLRGCCVAHFRGRIVGSYVVDTPRGAISVIVVTDTPQSIGMTRMPEQTKNDQIFWSSSFTQCNMVAVRIGDYSYCAVGENSHEYLTELLSRLMPETQR